jgi:hypothetical protein
MSSIELQSLMNFFSSNKFKSGVSITAFQRFKEESISFFVRISDGICSYNSFECVDFVESVEYLGKFICDIDS